MKACSFRNDDDDDVLQAAMVLGSIIFSAGCALTYVTINKVRVSNETVAVC